MATDWRQELDEAIDQRFDQMVELRRHFHRNPEVSGQERETSLYLYQLLGDAGLDVRMGPDGRGIMVDAVAQVGRPARGVVGLRADIDALRIHDEKNVDYRSQVDGVMHACGHDCHTAIAVTAITTLWQLGQAERLPWPIHVRGIFQPSEETAQGAREMISVGAMDGVEAIFALHVDPTRRVGYIGLRSGAMTATADEIEFHIQGAEGTPRVLMKRVTRSPLPLNLSMRSICSYRELLIAVMRLLSRLARSLVGTRRTSFRKR